MTARFAHLQGQHGGKDRTETEAREIEAKVDRLTLLGRDGDWANVAFCTAILDAQHAEAAENMALMQLEEPALATRRLIFVPHHARRQTQRRH
jgi:hypothetical protein